VDERFGRWLTLCTLNMHLLTYLERELSFLQKFGKITGNAFAARTK